jgi:alkylation response protein AidB-like acyl-CoA dehydrogenase
VSGEWTGTMCLTEPHCGTDLGMLRSRAEPQADGSYAITGTKIFISRASTTWRRTSSTWCWRACPTRPPAQGHLAVHRAEVRAGRRRLARRAQRRSCGRLEEKMGIHGNATCVINLDGATGWLVGEPNKGLNAMFVMMNAARLGVGMQSLGLAEVAYQNSLAYAKERLQGAR